MNTVGRYEFAKPSLRTHFANAEFRPHAILSAAIRCQDWRIGQTIFCSPPPAGIVRLKIKYENLQIVNVFNFTNLC
jgi:hypothetical protein